MPALSRPKRAGCAPSDPTDVREGRSSSLLADFFDIGKRLDLDDRALGVLAGLSPSLIRECRVFRRLPKQSRCIEAMRAFVDVNKTASSRADVRLSA